MRNYAGLIIVGIIAVILMFNLFNRPDNTANRGMSGGGNYQENTYEDLPDEPEKSEILDTIKASSNSSIQNVVKQSFPLLDTVKTDQGLSKIYVTRKLSLPEAADALSQQVKPQEISKRQEGKQVLVYKNDFVILQESQEQNNVVFIELASDQFVRNHYSPSFFDGLLAYYILDEVLDADDWFKKRKAKCQTQGNCYGGYVRSGGFNSGKTGSFRGSSQRGGGPGAGK
ncbi:DUF4247 domain-containing protein [Halobacillus salinarum]|uniref:DUF4247 domain-containing protein n=1 Tax=Halobacillus salinarum TaxID=2932257 RepID=A0ABY4ER70_9BACI|nr:DUF4247 domain-containing protein [Halobacillus salinarum]UOQ46154.1 DUF4247 domain-containing protein [Halobacillus salinarum]